MALVRIARFHSLSEAQVAASVLRSAGIEAVISDTYYLGVFPTDTVALGGFRLLVPQEDGMDAVEIIGSPPPPESLEEPAVRQLPAWQRLLAGFLLIFALVGVIAPETAWVAAVREKRRALAEKMLAAAITAVLALGGIVLLAIAILFLHEFLIDPP